MAVKNALNLVVAERQTCFYQLNDCLCHMVQLFLLLREKLLIAVDDHEIKLLMLNDWDLLVFVRELIQAIISSKNFGAYERCNEEIKVTS